MHIPLLDLYNMVCIGFRDARRDIQDPPPAQVPPSPPDPHDEEHMDARPDQEEIEEAINNFLQQLDKLEMFTPSELRLYQHAQDHRLTWDIP